MYDVILMMSYESVSVSYRLPVLVSERHVSPPISRGLKCSPPSCGTASPVLCITAAGLQASEMGGRVGVVQW